MILRRWGLVLCLVVLLHILRIEGVPEYIYEGDCLLEHFTKKTNILSTKEDKLNLIIARSDINSFYISVQENQINLTDNLQNTLPSGLVPYKLEFLEKGLTLVSLDKEYHWNWTSDDVSLDEIKEIYAKNVYVAKNCSQDLPYQKLSKNVLEVVFPLSQDREQRFKMFLVEKAKVKFYLGGQESLTVYLCWDQKEKKAFAQNIPDENCNALPILSPLGLNFFLNSSSHKGKITNMNTSFFDYSDPKVTFGFASRSDKGDVYVVQCLKECPKEDHTCDEFMEGTPTELLISLIVILSIANIASVIVIIYQCKRQRAAAAAQVHRDRETNTHGGVSTVTASREFIHTAHQSSSLQDF